MTALPRVFRLQQTFSSPRLDDIPGEVRRQLAQLPMAKKIQPGQTVAITAGSRGIANIATIIKAAVEHIKSVGGVPFIVPAMGSHGGGTVEGQCKILADYGITPASMGCDLRATMETVIVDTTPQGIPVHFDKHASQANHVLVVGRVKPHTGFVGEVESGLHKMMLIGLGKHEGAKIYHRAIANFSFMEIITAVAARVIASCRVIGGLAIVENARDETALVEAVPPDQFLERESRLLRQAIEWLPRLPFTECDLLIVDRIGKNISGTGMDTNVVGRKYHDHMGTDKDSARCKRILVRGLTDETHGNACGIGMAEFTTAKLVGQMDQKITAINCITGNHPTGGMIPLTFPNDHDAIVAALQTIGLTEPPQARVMQISDTLHVGEVIVSEAFLPQLAGRAELKALESPRAMQFDAQGNLADV